MKATGKLVLADQRAHVVGISAALSKERDKYLSSLEDVE